MLQSSDLDLRDQLREAIAEWKALESCFDEATDPALVDEIIHRQWAVRHRLRRLLGWKEASP